MNSEAAHGVPATNERPVVELDLHHLDPDQADEVAELVVQLGGDARVRYGDAGPIADILMYVVLVATPLKPFLDGMLSSAGAAVMGRILDRLPARDGTQVVTDGSPDAAGGSFVFREDAPAPEDRERAITAMAEVDTTAHPPATVFVWNPDTATWTPRT